MNCSSNFLESAKAMTGRQVFILMTLAGSLAGCAHDLPTQVSVTGALPSGSATLIENPSGEALLPAAQVAQCLAERGITPANPAEYLAQYSVAVRPAKSNLLVGKAAEAPLVAGKRGHLPKGERILYALMVDRLSDGARVYGLKIDAPYKAKKSSQQARSAQFCAGLSAKP
jgi:hypothetical protein